MFLAMSVNADETNNPPLAAAQSEKKPLAAALSKLKTLKPVAPLRAAKSQLVAFDSSPFPYRGSASARGTPFLDVVQGKRRGHSTDRGGVYWERPTYSDRRSLLYLPKGFDPRKPVTIVVFFHGNEAVLARDVRDRQQVPRQLAESGINAALVAPQFAVDALDSSAGRFWEKGVFNRFIGEAVERLTQLHGDKRTRAALQRAPVVIVAYSGGYLPAAYAAQVGGADERLRGMILLDAPYDVENMFADWVMQRRNKAFFVSTYTAAARDSNRLLQRMLVQRGVGFQMGLPTRLSPGTVAFFDAGDDIVHGDFVTRAWTNDPLKFLLSKIDATPPLRTARNP